MKATKPPKMTFFIHECSGGCRDVGLWNDRSRGKRRLEEYSDGTQVRPGPARSWLGPITNLRDSVCTRTSQDNSEHAHRQGNIINSLHQTSIKYSIFFRMILFLFFMKLPAQNFVCKNLPLMSKAKTAFVLSTISSDRWLFIPSNTSETPPPDKSLPSLKRGSEMMASARSNSS